MPEPMKCKVTISKDGKVVTEVIDRGQHLCSTVYKVTQMLGKQLSDEEIGPECDTQTEIQGS
jgi:hypothetical protein